MRQLLNLFKQDMVLAARNSLMLVLVGLIVLMGVMVRFVLPKEWAPTETYYYVDQTETGRYQDFLKSSGVKGRFILDDEAALRAEVKSDETSIGVLFDGSTAHPKVTILHSNRVGAESLNVLKAALNAIVSRVSGQTSSVDPGNIQFLRERAEPVPLNLTALPVLVAFEVLVLGFMFVAVFIFQEKGEGSIRAYRVSPGGTATYILSKALAFLVLGCLYGLGLIIATMGFSADFGRLLLLLILGINLYTLIGITIAVFFRNISGWLFPAVLILTVNMAPMVSLMFPMFSPEWMTWLPSYPIVFGVAEVLFPSGKSILPIIGLLAVENVAAYIICHVATHRKMMREGRV